MQNDNANTYNGKRNGAIIYRGPSQLDGAPIVVIVTGINRPSKNEKTGPMLQTWILREDVAPNEALHSGADASICGNCPHRGRLEFKTTNGTTEQRNVGRSCYVTVHQAPLSVFKAYKNGNYADLTGEETSIRHIGEGAAVRVGSYGDPAAVPVNVWFDLTKFADTWTGYTHQWERYPELNHLVMASCDSTQERTEAHSLGWRTFRVRRKEDLLASTEIACPASEEGGNKSQCIKCGLCKGKNSNSRKSIAIVIHGAGRKHFEVAA